MHAKSEKLPAFGDRKMQIPEFPRRVTVELTNNCNFKCSMCPRRFMTSPKGYISFPLFRKIIDEMAFYGDIILVPFFRGEPLLHPEFESMMSYAKPRVASIQLATNASLMTPEKSRAIIDLELDFISFSIDSIDPERYRAIRKNGELESVLCNIEYLCAVKAEKKAEKPVLQVSLVKTADTEEDMKSFVRYWRTRVDRVRIYREHSREGSFGSLGKGGLTDTDSVQERKPCLKPFRDLVVYWNGDVALCNHDWDRKNPLGSVCTDSIHEIWGGNAYRNIRQAHHTCTGLEQLCKNCDHWISDYLEEQMIGEAYDRRS